MKPMDTINPSVADQQLEEQLRGMLRFYTPLVSDTMERLGIQSGALHHSIQPVLPDPHLKVCGIAFPCRVVATEEYVEIHTLLEMVDNIPDHAFVVVSSDRQIDAALWGGLMSARAKSRGAVGAAVNGGVRDIEQIADLGFPVFGSYRCIKDIRRRGYMAKYNVPVYTGGITIVPGDIVFGDANGVIVIPREKFDQVYAELDRVFSSESETHRGLVEGRDARGLFDEHGTF
jgi:regulator of RNase E activity RraA